MLVSAALVVAARRARASVVVARSQIEFTAPVKVGALAETTARVLSVNSRSIEVGAHLWAEDLETSARCLAARATFVFVVVDHDGRPRSPGNEQAGTAGGEP